MERSVDTRVHPKQFQEFSPVKRFLGAETEELGDLGPREGLG